MVHLYYKTEFEKKIEKLLMTNGILNPSDLTIEHLAYVFNIQVVYMPNATENAIWDEEYSVIFLDSNKTLLEQREIFFHELAHPLLHVGDQMGMLAGFRDFQERQAKNFQLYTAMPFYMIKRIEFPSEERLIVNVLSDTFNVTRYLAETRWEQIRRRIYSSRFQNQYTIIQPVKSKIWSRETQRILDKLYRQTEVRA